MRHAEPFATSARTIRRAGRRGFVTTAVRGAAKLVLGTLFGAWIAAGPCFAQGSLPRVQACLLEVPNVFGMCEPGPIIVESTDPPCNLHYEIWSDEFSAQVNQDVGGVAECDPVLPPSTRPPTCCTGRSFPTNYPPTGGAPGKNWFVHWFGEVQPDSPGHIGYYAAHAQIVNPGELGDPRSLDCRPIFPLACFPPIGPPRPPFPPVAHSVFRADGTEVEPLGPLSPIPIPRARLDKENLLIHLDWDSAGGVVITDAAPNPIAGFQVWVAEDTDRDGIFPEPIPFPDYRPLARVPGGSTSLAVSILDLDPLAEVIRFALQVLYRSTPSPLESFERRSGYARPDLPGLRFEGLSANGNLIELGLLALIRNFSGVYDGGNRVLLSWEVVPAVAGLDHFEVLVAKSAAGLDVGNIPAHLAGSTLFVPYDPSAGPNQELSVVDGNAGRTGSKINLYILRVVFDDGADAVSDPVVVDLTDTLE